MTSFLAEVVNADCTYVTNFFNFKLLFPIIFYGNDYCARIGDGAGPKTTGS